MFIGSCPWLWNDWFEPLSPWWGGHAWFPTALDVQGFGFDTPGSLPRPQQQLFPNLEVQACPRSCSTCGRHSLRVRHPLVLWDPQGSALWERLDPQGSAPSLAIPVEVLGLDVLRGWVGAGVDPPQALGVTTQILHWVGPSGSSRCIQVGTAEGIWGLWCCFPGRFLRFCVLPPFLMNKSPLALQ